MSQDKGTKRGVQRKAVNTKSRAVDQHGRRAVNDVAGGDLLYPGLQAPTTGDRRALIQTRRVEKMVPIVTATSIFDEPSSGSKTIAYFASGEVWPRSIGCSFSSEAMMPMVSRKLRQSIRHSFA